jgi:nucleoside-triphosphatase THEP1
VVVGVTSPTNGVPTAEQAQDYFHNAQAVRVITSSLCDQEFNKVRNVEVPKKIWDTLREAHKRTDEVREGKMDLLQEELEHSVTHDEETMRQMYDRLMVLMSDIRSLGSMEWEDNKVTKKLLRAFTPRNPTLATMKRRDPKFKIKTPNQLLGEILHQELVERDVAMSLSHKVNKNVVLNASSSDRVGSGPKALKLRKEDSSDEGSTMKIWP